MPEIPVSFETGVGSGGGAGEAHFDWFIPGIAVSFEAGVEADSGAGETHLDWFKPEILGEKPPILCSVFSAWL